MLCTVPVHGIRLIRRIRICWKRYSIDILMDDKYEGKDTRRKTEVVGVMDIRRASKIRNRHDIIEVFKMYHG